MEITSTTMIIVGVVCVGLGIIAGMLLNTLSDNSETPPASVDEAPPGGRKGRYTPIVRLWRERSAGTLVVEMDGKAMVSPEPLSDVQRERLENTARDLRAWLGMGLPAAEQIEEPVQSDLDLNRVIPPEPVKKAAQPAPKPAPSSTPAAAPIPVPRPAAAPAAPARSTPTPPPVPKLKDEPVAPAASKSIVMQIEDILQDMIAGTPLEQRGVHLTEDPIRGVIVKVGLERYEGIDAVADPEVKRIIQSAVQEWEKSQ